VSEEIADARGRLQLVLKSVIFGLILLITFCKKQILFYQPNRSKETNNMTEPIRITVENARQRVEAGTALLVCAYDDDEKFSSYHLQGAISLNDFRAKLPSLSAEQEIIFYCA
jgi:hypothetical protein